MLRQTWSGDAAERPTFTHIVRFFEHLDGKRFFVHGAHKAIRNGAVVKDTLWTLEKAAELERAALRQKRYDDVVSFVRNRDIEVAYSALRFGSKLGEGSFSVVWEATLGNYKVAVKKLKNPAYTQVQFMREVGNLWRARHRSVVLLLGACTSPPCVITEYMPYNLYDALHVRRV